VADPLRRADCCVVTDGGGAVVLVHPDLAKGLKQPRVQVRAMSASSAVMSGGASLRVRCCSAMGRVQMPGCKCTSQTQ
jgi:acetyl-CoA acetyltransferase